MYLFRRSLIHDLLRSSECPVDGVSIRLPAKTVSPPFETVAKRHRTFASCGSCKTRAARCEITARVLPETHLGLEEAAAAMHRGLLNSAWPRDQLRPSIVVRQGIELPNVIQCPLSATA